MTDKKHISIGKGHRQIDAFVNTGAAHNNLSDHSNSRSVLKILCDLCRKPLAEPFDDLFLAFVTTGTASIDVRLGTQPLLAGVDVELRHGHGIPEKAVASKDA